MSHEPDEELRQKFDAAMAARHRDATDEASRLLAQIVSDPRADKAMLTHSYVQLGYLSKEVFGQRAAAACLDLSLEDAGLLAMMNDFGDRNAVATYQPGRPWET